MTRAPISSTHVESTFVDRLEAGVYQRGRWSSRVWNVLCFLLQEVLHA